MQTANDADGGNVFPDITAEEAGYSATARIERKRERTRDGALQRNVRKATSDFYDKKELRLDQFSQ